MKIRKQIDDLSIEDLQRHPVWEFALDEELEEGQDEATVRPYRAQGPLNPAVGVFAIRTQFTLCDGSPFVGYLTPPVEGVPSPFAFQEDDGSSTRQPAIVTPLGQVPFWFGWFPPDAPTLTEAYRRLGKSAGQVFPIRYRTAVDLTSGVIDGQLKGFLFVQKERRGLLFRRLPTVRTRL